MPPLNVTGWLYGVFITLLAALSVVHALEGVQNYGGLSRAHLNFQSVTAFGLLVCALNGGNLMARKAQRSTLRRLAIFANVLLLTIHFLYWTQASGAKVNVMLLTAIGIAVLSILNRHPIRGR